MDMEVIVMEIVVNSGDARSKALEAIHAARKKDFEQAEVLLVECANVLQKAHETQTKLIQKEARGEQVEMGMLMVHAQDHLMNALTVKDLAEQMIYILKENSI